MNQTVCRLTRGIGCLAHYSRWSWRFGKFGFRSRLAGPAMLTGCRRIEIGKGVCIRRGARIEVVGDDGKIEIGDGTSIQLGFHCGAAKHVRIGRDVLIAGRVYISDHDHVFDHRDLPPRRCKELAVAPVEIGDGAWLGEGSVVLKGVSIGRRAVVGANAVVTRSVPDGCVVGGVPAKIIRRIEFNEPLISEPKAY